ncbi:Protein-S-isoprenylcysteine O-methyltransferase [Mycena venus]|uniref:Protein-S-isoprenylcysteine O-methyltransferase n=1 Tax=Mycena venus TaxID=2733690 RepID=A0A8H7D783_9AGAR|nr:Protein-S-isoprenylcysteine O-methyltransferase [Mycena venus]
MSLMKIPCILYAMLGFQIAVTPPHPPPPPDEQLASTFFEVLLRQRSGPVVIKVDTGEIQSLLWDASSKQHLLRCYCELGNLFTFEVSIPTKLIQTGPYHAVRHPGYLGVLLTVAGVFCWIACPGSWLRECGALETAVGLSIVIICTVLVILITAGLLLRISTEDETLEQRFGEDWVQWSVEVPYKLIPGIF